MFSNDNGGLVTPIDPNLVERELIKRLGYYFIPLATDPGLPFLVKDASQIIAAGGDYDILYEPEVFRMVPTYRTETQMYYQGSYTGYEDVLVYNGEEKIVDKTAKVTLQGVFDKEGIKKLQRKHAEQKNFYLGQTLHNNIAKTATTFFTVVFAVLGIVVLLGFYLFVFACVCFLVYILVGMLIAIFGGNTLS